MSDWKFLERHRVTTPVAGIPEEFCSDSSFGFNGLFRFSVGPYWIRCMASDGEGWQHVSVSVENDKRPPKWEVMCAVKEVFWEDEDWVVQFHPAKSEYVNYHSGCLHLWRCLNAPQPTPPSIMVGPKPKA